MRHAQAQRVRAPECTIGSGPLEELGFVNRCVRKEKPRITEALFDEVGRTLHLGNDGQDVDGPFAGHWYTAHPDPLDLKRWNARIPFIFLGNQLEASVPATAIHDRKVILFSSEELDRSIYRPAAMAFTLAFATAFWKLYSNAIMNPAHTAR